MKKSLYFIIAAVLLLVTSCNKSDSEAVSGSGIQGFWELMTDISPYTKTSGDTSSVSPIIIKIDADSLSVLVQQNGEWYLSHKSPYTYDATAKTFEFSEGLILTNFEVGSQYAQGIAQIGDTPVTLKFRRHKAVAFSDKKLPEFE